MLKSRQKTALVGKAALILATRQVCGHDFHRDGLFEPAVDALGQVYGAHAAAADEADELVYAERLGGNRGSLVENRSGIQRLDGREVVMGEQGFYVGQKFRIRATVLREP